MAKGIPSEIEKLKGMDIFEYWGYFDIWLAKEKAKSKS